MENIDNLKIQVLEEINGATDVKALEDIRVAVLGKKGRLTEQMKGLSGLDIEARKQLGQQLNSVKGEIEKALETRKQELAAKELDKISGVFIRFQKFMKKLSPSLVRWGLKLPTGRISKISFTTLMR